MANFEIYATSISGSEHLLSVEFDYTIGNDGIGHYEYWGAHCYDEGTYYIEEVNILSIKLVHEVYSKKVEDCAKRILRKIDFEKLKCLNLDEISEKIADEFDWEKDKDDNSEDF